MKIEDYRPAKDAGRQHVTDGSPCWCGGERFAVALNPHTMSAGFCDSLEAHLDLSDSVIRPRSEIISGDADLATLAKVREAWARWRNGYPHTLLTLVNELRAILSP